MKLFALTFTGAAAAGLHLDTGNFAEKASGKSVFLKFYAPW